MKSESYHISCDHPKCRAYLENLGDIDDGVEEAEGLDWTLGDDADVCPACSEDPKKVAEAKEWRAQPV